MICINVIILLILLKEFNDMKKKNYYKKNKIKTMLDTLQNGRLLKDNCRSGNRIVIRYFIETENRRLKITEPTFKLLEGYIEFSEKYESDNSIIECYKLKDGAKYE